MYNIGGDFKYYLCFNNNIILLKKTKSLIVVNDKRIKVAIWDTAGRYLYFLIRFYFNFNFYYFKNKAKRDLEPLLIYIIVIHYALSLYLTLQVMHHFKMYKNG